MTKTRIAFFLTCVLLVTSSAFAQASRTWVSGVGDDVNPCSRTAPCKTFAGAISKTATDGEIDVLDPGGFGGVTITKGMRINGLSFNSSVLVANTVGITVNAPGGKVQLSHIQIQGIATGTNGINVVNVGKLTIDHCDIINFNTTGINVNMTTSAQIQVLDTNITNIPGNGVLSTTTAGAINLNIDHTSFNNCGTGVHTQANSIATVSNSTLTSNGTALQADNASVMLATGDTITENTSGIVSLANSSAVRLSHNFIQQNAVGFNVTAPSNIFTAGNNSIQQTGNTGVLQAMGGQT
jgi:hypothetical protein